MAYITKAKVEAVYGVNNIAKWSNLDNDDAQANDARIDDAITYAEAYIDDKLRGGRYVVPVTGTIAMSEKRWSTFTTGSLTAMHGRWPRCS